MIKRAEWRKPFVLAIILTLALSASGCANNMTGFSFPRFGLLGNNAEDEAARSLNPNAGYSQRLMDSSVR